MSNLWRFSQTAAVGPGSGATRSGVQMTGSDHSASFPSGKLLFHAWFLEFHDSLNKIGIRCKRSNFVLFLIKCSECRQVRDISS